MNAEMIHRYQRMKKDLEAAARIQRSLLPSASPLIDGVRVAWDVVPCEELAGDSLNLLRLDERHLGVYILDVSGHGLEAALLAVTLHKVIDAIAGGPSLLSRRNGSCCVIVTPAELCTELNRIFPMDPVNGQYFTLLYGLFDAVKKEFRYVAAGHHAPVYLPPLGGPVEISNHGFPIGVVQDAQYEERVIEVERGGRLYLYSDGLIDAECSCEGPFGTSRILQTIEAGRSRTLRQSVDDIIKRVRDWSSTARLEDDASLLALEVG
jgi:sigma-B regulation protein RsbU (phosphoserine phosphatase)